MPAWAGGMATGRRCQQCSLVRSNPDAYRTYTMNSAPTIQQ
jgi:hypothetical protein